MTIRKRLERLESARPPMTDRPPVMLGLCGTTDVDVIGIGNGPRLIKRQPAEALDNLIERAHPLLATPWAGMPLIMSYAYSDEALARGRDQ